MEALFEDFMPPELADRMKGIGFDWAVFGLYNPQPVSADYESDNVGLGLFYHNSSYYKKSGAILWQQAQRWFIEKHGIHVYADPLWDGRHKTHYIPRLVIRSVKKDGFNSVDWNSVMFGRKDYTERIDAMRAAFDKAIKRFEKKKSKK